MDYMDNTVWYGKDRIKQHSKQDILVLAFDYVLK